MHKYAFFTLVLITAITLGGCSLGAAEPPAGATAEPAGSSVAITFGAVSFIHHIYEPLNAAQKLTSGSDETKQYGFVIPRGQSEAGKFLAHLFGAALIQRSGEALRDADEPARRLGDARRDGVLALHRAQFLWASGRSREAWPLIEHASAVGHGAADVALSTSAVLYAAAIQVALGDLREAERGFRRVTDALSGAGDARSGGASRPP